MVKKYNPGVAVPRLSFHLSSTEILVVNNEAGFTEADVRALCNVGSSTKAKAVGFIGHKGIGFKSCFGVSDEPAIHSNGFHFHLDAKHKIVPHEIPPKDVPKAVKKHAKETCICLPFNKKTLTKTPMVSSKFGTQQRKPFSSWPLERSLLTRALIYLFIFNFPLPCFLFFCPSRGSDADSPALPQETSAAHGGRRDQ